MAQAKLWGYGVSFRMKSHQLFSFIPAAFLFVFLGIPLVAQDPVPALPPGTMLLPESALPKYEAAIDHAGLIRKNQKGVIKQGQEIYQQVCHNCHGDINLPGSIPNSLRFAEGEFQHGNDPYTMYQTISRGWRLMVPQVQLVLLQAFASSVLNQIALPE